jgi:hypothetical protein
MPAAALVLCVQPGGICAYGGTARADTRGPGAGLAVLPQALPVPAAALVLYICIYLFVYLCV